MLAKTMILLIDIYRICLSPFLPRSCRFYPSCSAYARESLVCHGLVKGLYLTGARLFKCHPFHPGGFDPGPPPNHHTNPQEI